jgi:hypothetical protein
MHVSPLFGKAVTSSYSPFAVARAVSQAYTAPGFCNTATRVAECAHQSSITGRPAVSYDATYVFSFFLTCNFVYMVIKIFEEGSARVKNVRGAKGKKMNASVQDIQARK